MAGPITAIVLVFGPATAAAVLADDAVGIAATATVAVLVVTPSAGTTAEPAGCLDTRELRLYLVDDGRLVIAGDSGRQRCYGGGQCGLVDR